MHSLQVPRTQPIVIQPQTKSPQTEQDQLDECLEQYVVEMLDKSRYQLLEWRSDRESFHHHQPESFTYPHLEFESEKKKTRFALKCKWQDADADGTLAVSQTEIDNFLNYQQKRHTPVYVLFATGNNPFSPDQMFLAPLNVVKDMPKLTEAELARYRFEPGQEILA